jgi:hypothetical protein
MNQDVFGHIGPDDFVSQRFDIGGIGLSTLEMAPHVHPFPGEKGTRTDEIQVAFSGMENREHSHLERIGFVRPGRGPRCRARTQSNVTVVHFRTFDILGEKRSPHILAYAKNAFAAFVEGSDACGMAEEEVQTVIEVSIFACGEDVGEFSGLGMKSAPRTNDGLGVDRFGRNGVDKRRDRSEKLLRCPVGGRRPHRPAPTTGYARRRTHEHPRAGGFKQGAKGTFAWYQGMAFNAA